MPVFLIYAACAFASGFALRLVDPIVLPVAGALRGHGGDRGDAQHRLRPALRAGAALPRPDRRPLRQAALHPGLRRRAGADARRRRASPTASPSCSRPGSVAGIFAGGLIPLVLAGLGDTYAMSERQVALGRMLFAIISGQMLGSVVSGFANVAFGWRSALFIASARRRGRGDRRLDARCRRRPRHGDAPAAGVVSRALYGRVFANPKAAWLYRRGDARGRALLRRVPVHGRAAARDHGARRRRDLDRDRHRPRRLRHRRPALRRERALCCCAGSACAGCACSARPAPPPATPRSRSRRSGGSTPRRCSAPASPSTCCTTRCRPRRPSSRRRPAARPCALFACGFFVGSGLGPLVFGGLLHALGPQAGARRRRGGDRRPRPGRGLAHRRPAARRRRWSSAEAARRSAGCWR